MPSSPPSSSSRTRPCAESRWSSAAIRKGRGVVATANYVARRYGIHSAMSCAEALRRCPDAVFVRPRHMPCTASTRGRSGARSARSSRPSSDRDRRGLPRPRRGRSATSSPPGRLAEAVQSAVRGATSLTCSLGVAACKVVAKVASDRRKPGGLTVVRPGREAAFLAPFDVRLLPGVGPRAEERLRAAGVPTIGALAALDDAALRRLLPGKVGDDCSATARAGSTNAGSRPRSSGSRSRPRRPSSGTSTTAEQLHAELRRMAGRLAEHLERTGPGGPDVTTKVRYPDFAIRSRSSTLAAGLDDGRRDRRRRLRAPRPRAGRPARARYASSASACRTSSRSGSWPCTSQEAGGAAAAARSSEPASSGATAPSGVRASPAQTSAIASNRAGSSPAAD